MKHTAQPRLTTGESLGSLVGASLTVVGDAMYVFGGFDQYSDEVFNALYRLVLQPDDVEGKCRWERVLYTRGKAPAKRNDHTATLWKARTSL